MLGKVRTSDTSQILPRCLFTPHPAFFPRTSWPKKVQTVWPQWLFQPWPKLWISHSRLAGPYVRSELCTTTWIGFQTSGKPRSWSLPPSRKALTKISSATIFSWIKQKVILCYELSDQEALTLHQV